jgi:hypothetical protein
MISVVPPGSENVPAPDFLRVRLLTMMLIIGIERLLEPEAHPGLEDRMSTHTSRLTGKMILVDGGMTGHLGTIDHLEMIDRLEMIDHPGTTDHGMSDDDETAETIAATTEIVAR